MATHTETIKRILCSGGEVYEQFRGSGLMCWTTKWQGWCKQWEVHCGTAGGDTNIALGFAYSRCFIMQCLILIKKVQVYIIYELIYSAVCACAYMCVCGMGGGGVWVTDWDAPLLKAIQPATRLLLFHGTHITTIPLGVKRIYPSRSQYI